MKIDVATGFLFCFVLFVLLGLRTWSWKFVSCVAKLISKSKHRLFPMTSPPAVQK